MPEERGQSAATLRSAPGIGAAAFETMTTDPITDTAPSPDRTFALRLAVLVDGDSVPGWQATLLQRLIADRTLEITSLVRAGPEATASPRWAPGVSARLADRLDLTVARLRYGGPWRRVPIPPDAVVEVSGLQGVPPVQGGTSGTDQWAAAEVVLDLTADGLARRCVGMQRGPRALPVVRLGQVALQDDSIATLGRRETIADRPFAELAAVLCTGDEVPFRVLRAGTYVTFRYSWNANRWLLQHKAALLLHDALRQLGRARQGGAVGWQQISARLAPLPTPPEPTHEHACGLRSLLRVLTRTCRRGLEKRLSSEQWCLVTHAGVATPQSLDRMQLHTPPAGHFWADPFALSRAGADWVFFEQYDFAVERAAIWAARLVDGHLLDQRPVVAPPYHVSYPHLLEHRGELYMVPESYHNGGIELWRCARFPYRWLRERTLIDGLSAADATIFAARGRWWMLANVDRTGLPDHADELHVFHTDDPITGRWLAHPDNPVVTDARVARMGGAVIHRPDGRLIRPAQVGGDIYGSGIQFMEITELSETGYAERPGRDLLSWMAEIPRIHHCHATKRVTVADICRVMPWRARLGLAAHGTRSSCVGGSHDARDDTA